jgi:hypothetical protein
MGGRLLLLSMLLLPTAQLAGCAAPDPLPGPSVSRTATLVIVVYSAHAQRAVAAEGTLTMRADGSTRAFDTRGTPDEGQAITGLAPGAYRVQISRRFDPSGRARRVDGVEEVYLEPGQRSQVTIVVIDREGELGRATSPENSPAASSSRLPRATTRPGGPS